MSLEIFEKSAVLLLDVAGTLSSSDFLTETLYPFVIKNLEEFLKSHTEDAEVKKILKGLSDNTEKELEIEAAVEKIKKLTTEGSDNEHVKSMQGMISKQGYEAGDIKAHVFGDVKECLESWSPGHKIAVFSTGSVVAQKLYFEHTKLGDLSSNIAHYFDQTVGKKSEKESYEKIAKELNVESGKILFITDLAEEGKAAKSAGMECYLITREGNKEISEDDKKEFKIIESLTEITSAKRKNEDAETTEAPPTKVAKTDDAEADAKKKKKTTEEKIQVEEKEEKKTEKKGDVAEKAAVEVEAEKMEVDSTEKVEGEQKEQKMEEETKVTEEKKGNEEVAEDKKTDEKDEEIKEDVQKEKEIVVEEVIEKEEAKKKEEEKKPAVEETKVEESKETPKTPTEEVAKTEDKENGGEAPVVKEVEQKTEEKTETETVKENGIVAEKSKETKSELVNGSTDKDKNGVVEEDKEKEKSTVEGEDETKKVEETPEVVEKEASGKEEVKITKKIEEKEVAKAATTTEEVGVEA